MTKADDKRRRWVCSEPGCYQFSTHRLFVDNAVLHYCTAHQLDNVRKLAPQRVERRLRGYPIARRKP